LLWCGLASTKKCSCLLLLGCGFTGAKKKTKTNNVIIPCHFGVVVQVQKNDVEELRCLSLFVVVMVWYCMHEKMTIINYDLHHCCSVV
jgi:hypothetical protein